MQRMSGNTRGWHPNRWHYYRVSVHRFNRQYPLYPFDEDSTHSVVHSITQLIDWLGDTIDSILRPPRLLSSLEKTRTIVIWTTTARSLLHQCTFMLSMTPMQFICTSWPLYRTLSFWPIHKYIPINGTLMRAVSAARTNIGSTAYARLVAPCLIYDCLYDEHEEILVFCLGC